MTIILNLKTKIVCLLIVFLQAQSAAAVLNFSDDFNGPVKWAWSSRTGVEDRYGSWKIEKGTFKASKPDNRPNAHSLVRNLELRDFTVLVDVKKARNGGVWLRAKTEGGVNVGVSGILFTIAGDGDAYWHIAHGDSYGRAQARMKFVFKLGDDVQLRIVVRKNKYSAYLNGSDTPVTVLENDQFESGLVGLYDFNEEQSFDNFQIWSDADDQ